MRRCLPILRGGLDDAEAIIRLGGVPGEALLRDHLHDVRWNYWPRVWAARALRYVWDERAGSGVIEALHDEHWRVREMAAKVCLRRDLGQAGDTLATLVDDETARVRAAVAWALGGLGESEHANVPRSLLDDPDATVRLRAKRALEMMSRRLDRELQGRSKSSRGARMSSPGLG